MLVEGLRHTPVRAPDGVWIEPGAWVRLQGTLENGTLVVADSLTAVRRLAPSPNAARDVSPLPSTETTAVVPLYFQGETGRLGAHAALGGIRRGDDGLRFQLPGG